MESRKKKKKAGFVFVQKKKKNANPGNDFGSFENTMGF